MMDISSIIQSCLTLCDPMNAAHQASLSITNSRSLLKLMSIQCSVLNSQIKNRICQNSLEILMHYNYPSIYVFKLLTPILWPHDVNNWLIWKDPGAGKDWRREEKGTTEDEMVGWHHRFNGHEFEKPPGDGEGQGNLACYSSWGHKESTWLSNWTTI